MLKREFLHDYQTRAVNFILEKKKVGLLLSLGLGKTVSSLTAITDLYDSFSISKALIIAPLRVANTVWHTEANNWQHTKHLKVNICTGSEKNRIAQLLKPADVYVINRENVDWLVNHYGKKWPFDCVVVDESSSFKNPSSRRFKALRKVFHMIDYCWLLTGTPTPNGLLDLWAQICLLDNGHRLGRNMTAYKQRFFESDYMGYKYQPRKGADKIIHRLIDDITLSMEAKDYIEVPDKIDLIEKIQLPPKAMTIYKELEKEFFVTLGNGIDIETPSAATLANKLVQVCNGAAYIDDEKNAIELHKAKLEALADIVDDNPDENILIAYNYKTDLDRIKKRFPHAVVMDKKGEAVDKWNNGQIKMLLAHPASAGHGLNLQKGGSMIVWFGLNWSLELYQQFNGRLHRQGQSKPVRIIHLVADGCIDEKIVTAITNKAETQQELIEALK